MYNYRITLEWLESTTQSQTPQERTIQFQVPNHDDLLKIVKAVRSKGIMDADKSAALAVGLKLFSEIVLEKRNDPLFAPLWEPIRLFTGQLKAFQASGLAEQDRDRVADHS
ncbi:DUF3861 domain-containing protein [Granulicella arctica]|uniref:DUF3861 domain-containing protein n=1 Tax=Granulicella arctica TaxID=940613 RepID=UPI0021DFAEBA|nr:DUF3861 domain-containing protein [Granulicella arctica]